MHRIQCKFIKSERKLHYVVSLPIPSYSSLCVRCVPPCGAFGLGAVLCWRGLALFFSPASFARFCSSALLFSLSRSFSSLLSCLAFSFALSWAIMSAIIFFVSATPASSSAGRQALVSTPSDRAFSFFFSGWLGFSLCWDWIHAKASLVGFVGPATLATYAWWV